VLVTALCAAAKRARRSKAAGRLLRRWQVFLDMLGVFAEFKTNLRRARPPKSIAKPKAAGEGGNRREGMMIDLPQINCPARAAARAEYVEPGRSGNQRGPDRRRPHDVRLAVSCSFQRSTTALASRGRIGNLPLLATSRSRVHAAVSPESGRATIVPPGVSPSPGCPGL
jgi:hypothetical protein